jgi:hypothetical protein
VTQLIKDFEDLKVVNQQLDKMYARPASQSHCSIDV